MLALTIGGGRDLGQCDVFVNIRPSFCGQSVLADAVTTAAVSLARLEIACAMGDQSGLRFCPRLDSARCADLYSVRSPILFRSFFRNYVVPERNVRSINGNNLNLFRFCFVELRRARAKMRPVRSVSK